MRLTNIIRDSFVRSVMQDLPSLVNYEEQAHKIYKDDAIEQMPPQLRPIALDKELSTWLETNSVYSYSSPFSSTYVFSQRGRSYNATDRAKAKVAELVAKAKAQQAERDALEQKLKGIAYGCTTRKVLAEALPEFEKYLPADEPAACRSLPAVANLVADFAKAGWPKQATKTGKKAAA
jgi:hypothetical protein